MQLITLFLLSALLLVPLPDQPVDAHGLFALCTTRLVYQHLWTLLRMGGVCNILFIETLY